MTILQTLRKIAAAQPDYRFYNSIVESETGSVPNQWTRTKHAPAGGSTAYGPAQLTRTKLLDYFKRFPKRMMKHAPLYNDVMKNMYNNFVEYGKEPNKPGYDKRWDYGGQGVDLTQQQKDAYKDTVLTMQQIDADEAKRLLPKGTPRQLLQKRIELWRGKKAKADPRYFRTFYKQYNSEQPDEIKDIQMRALLDAERNQPMPHSL